MSNPHSPDDIQVDAHVALRTIERDELHAKIQRGDAFKLVMVVSEWGFRVKHIPGSLHFKSYERMFAALAKDDPIVVYCSNLDCHASLAAVRALLEHGYTDVRHYAGGLIDWETAGLPLEGDWAQEG
jgi:rhodanese-related sulfurtransferase